MTRSKMFSFRVDDTLIVQQLDAMDDRSDFIRRAVIEKLSADAVDRDAVLRLRAGLVSRYSPKPGLNGILPAKFEQWYPGLAATAPDYQPEVRPMAA